MPFYDTVGSAIISMAALISCLRLRCTSTVTIEDDINITTNGTPFDSSVSLELGMNNHPNDAANLCLPQPVYNPRSPPHQG